MKKISLFSEIILNLLKDFYTFMLNYYIIHFFKEEIEVLGMEDVWIGLAWILSLLSMVGCIIYGAIKWNEGEDEE